MLKIHKINVAYTILPLSLTFFRKLEFDGLCLCLLLRKFFK